MQKFNNQCEEIEKQYRKSLLPPNGLQQMHPTNHRYYIKSEPRSRTNLQDQNKLLDKISCTEPRKVDKENKLVLRTQNNQFLEFPIYSDSKMTVWERCYFDDDNETTKSWYDRGIKMCTHELDLGIRMEQGYRGDDENEESKDQKDVENLE